MYQLITRKINKRNKLTKQIEETKLKKPSEETN